MRPIYALVLVACTSPGSPPQAQDARVPGALPSDAYYDQPMTDFCSPSGPVECELELGFCADGTYTNMYGDIGTVGTYRIDDGVAIDDANHFAFDLTTQLITAGPDASDQPWQATTVVQDADVACMQ